MSSCRLAIRVIPRARREEVVGERGESITIKLVAPPVKGAANKALVALLSRRLGVSPGAITLVGGETAREKRLVIEGLTESEARARLLSEP